MKANEKGFSVVEILIVIVVVGLLGAVGWLVYGKQKSQQDSNKTEATQPTATERTDESQQKLQIPEGFAEYRSDELGLRFIYPKEWGNPETSNYAYTSLETDKQKGRSILFYNQTENIVRKLQILAKDYKYTGPATEIDSKFSFTNFNEALARYPKSDSNVIVLEKGDDRLAVLTHEIGFGSEFLLGFSKKLNLSRFNSEGVSMYIRYPASEPRLSAIAEGGSIRSTDANDTHKQQLLAVLESIEAL